MKEYGIVIVSHVEGIGLGLKKLIQEIAGDVSVSVAAGLGEEVGTSFEDISQAIEDNKNEKILAFYDLGSAKMNLEMCIETSDKDIKLYDVALIEGVYVAAALLQADVDITEIESQLEPLKIK